MRPNAVGSARRHPSKDTPHLNLAGERGIRTRGSDFVDQQLTEIKLTLVPSLPPKSPDSPPNLPPTERGGVMRSLPKPRRASLARSEVRDVGVAGSDPAPATTRQISTRYFAIALSLEKPGTTFHGFKRTGAGVGLDLDPDDGGSGLFQLCVGAKAGSRAWYRDKISRKRGECRACDVHYPASRVPEPQYGE